MSEKYLIFKSDIKLYHYWHPYLASVDDPRPRLIVPEAWKIKKLHIVPEEDDKRWFADFANALDSRIVQVYYCVLILLIIFSNYLSLTVKLAPRREERFDMT